jgi:CheY-like chemotaxis protein
VNQKPLATPTFEKKDLARLVRQAAKSDNALQSFLAEHGDAHVEPNRQSGQLLAAQQQLLAVVKSHSGFMCVYSEVGQGTSFKLYFPAMTAENSVSKISDRPTLPLGHGELVMVVDDEFAVRQITCQTLEAFGYRVILAADGSEALSLFAVQQNDISLVITDMMMPVMDGNATIRVLTRMRPSVRIIAASGLNENHVIAKAMSNGVKHFLAKPYTAESLLTKIYEALM